ncbi:MAG: class I SAM-dependent methyltransferase [Candidatus Bathyarchaeota archaeon]|nr:class I SAM-dependent methyltransferase [Candidatus Bathyarchaeota archaeon]
MAWKQKRQIKQRYDITATMYDERYREEQRRKYRRALQTVNVADAVVADVGCGSGMFFPEAAQKTQWLIGVDISRKLLDLAKAQSKGYGNVSVVQADADHLPFRSGAFEAAFAFTVLQNMPSPALTLQEIKRVVGVGGKAVVTGLKKAFPLHQFMDALEASGMALEGFLDEEAINCYIAVLSA